MFAVFCAFQQRFHLARTMGQKQQEREFADNSIGIGERLVQAATNDSYYTYRLAGSLADSGVMHRQQNRLVLAEEHLERALGLARELSTNEPEYVAYQRLLCVIHLEFSRIKEEIAPSCLDRCTVAPCPW